MSLRLKLLSIWASAAPKVSMPRSTRGRADSAFLVTRLRIPAPPRRRGGVGAAQDFDLLDNIQRAVVLHVVAHAIDEEVGGGAHAAEHHCVAVTFTL